MVSLAAALLFLFFPGAEVPAVEDAGRVVPVEVEELGAAVAMARPPGFRAASLTVKTNGWVPSNALVTSACRFPMSLEMMLALPMLLRNTFASETLEVHCEAATMSGRLLTVTP